MTEPIYAQRYGAKRRLPPGRAGAAYAGRDAQGRPVVVTVVRPLDPDVFLRTVGVVASVRHLDLAPVVDAGREGGDCFVVTEDPGGTTRRRWPPAGRCPSRARPSRPPPPPRASPRSTSAASSTAASTRARSSAVRTAPSSSPAPVWPRRTRRPTCGRARAPDLARYLSPEEVTGRAPSPASDVYRLGLVTYLLLTGRHAFDGTDGSIVAQEQLDGVVRPPQLLNPEVPPALAQIVMRALEKDPGRARHRGPVPGRHRARAALRPGAGGRRRSGGRAGRGSGSCSSSSPPSPRSPSPGRSAPSTAAAASRSRTSPA